MGTLSGGLVRWYQALFTGGSSSAVNMFWKSHGFIAVWKKTSFSGFDGRTRKTMTHSYNWNSRLSRVASSFFDEAQLTSRCHEGGLLIRCYRYKFTTSPLYTITPPQHLGYLGWSGNPSMWVSKGDRRCRELTKAFLWFRVRVDTTTPLTPGAYIAMATRSFGHPLRMRMYFIFANSVGKLAIENIVVPPLYP